MLTRIALTRWLAALALAGVVGLGAASPAAARRDALGAADPPKAAGPSGTVFSGGFVRGTVTAGVGSAEAPTGIRALAVRVDGSRIAARGPDRGCDAAQCPPLERAESFPFDSALIRDGTHAVEVGVLDFAGAFGAADVPRQVTVDNTAPFAPMPLSPTPTTTAAPRATITWAEPAAQVAPLAAATIEACGPAGCQTTTESAGGGAGAATVSLPALGAYTVRVALRDAAGNLDLARAAAWTIVRTAASATLPAAVPNPLPAAAKASARLRLAGPTVARDRRTIVVRGTVAAGVAGRVTVTATARIGGRERRVTRRATPRDGRFRARLRLPSTAWRTARVTARFAGDAAHFAARVSRRATRR